MKITNRGVFKPVYAEHYNLIGLTPVDFDIADRELWLAHIQHLDSHMIGSGNYSTDYVERYNLIFRVNSGKGEGKSQMGHEDYFMVLQIEIGTWYRPKEHVRKEVFEGLEHYPIIFMNELLDAFEQRNYYRNSEIIKVE